MTLQLTFLGGAGTVTGSNFMIENDSSTLLVKCDLFQHYKQSRRRRRLPFTAFYNRTLARIAQLAGAPRSKTAGMSRPVKPDTKAEKNEPPCTKHSEGPGEFDCALAFAMANPDVVRVEAP